MNKQNTFYKHILDFGTRHGLTTHFTNDADIAFDNFAVSKLVFCQDGRGRKYLITNVTLLVARGDMSFHVLLQFTFCLERFVTVHT